MRMMATAVLCFLLAACEYATPYAMIDGAVIVGTQKTMADHVVSVASGKDCSLVRIERGQTYCKEDEVAGPRPNLYCYRELAGVSCYNEPDPRRSEQARLGNNDQNYVKKY